MGQPPPTGRIEALFHTNRLVDSWPTGDAIRAVPGWWGAHAAELGEYKVTGAYRKTPNATRKLKAKWNLPQSLKFEWSLAAATADTWVLADTDTVWQCTPEELRAKFEALGSPLVVGTEFWYDPYEAACRWQHFKYPNSGLLMGTRRGFAKLVREIRRQPDFPCCRQLPWDPKHDGTGGECFVDDQARLFLNLFMVYPRELTTNAKGQLVWRATGHAPCVIHTNAYKSPTMLEALISNWTHITWVPSNSTRLQRYLIRRQRGERFSDTNILARRRATPLQKPAPPVNVVRV